MRLLVALVLLLAAPASASAAPFGELPFRPVTSAAACLRPTGVPGELTRWVRGGAELLTARADGLVSTGRVALGRTIGCHELAGKPNGAAVLAAATEAGIRVALREPGGAWGAPTTLRGSDRYVPQVAINARGDAIVVWGEYGPGDTFRLYAARRPAGGPFGRPERLAAGDPTDVSIAVGGSGETFVVTAGEDVRLTSALPGASFPPPRRLLAGDGFSSAALAAADDGRVLIAVGTMSGLVLFEREPGGTEFVRRPRFAADDASIGVQLEEDGGAIVTWGGDVSTGALVRSGPGAFGLPIDLREERPSRPPTVPTAGGAGVVFTEAGEAPYDGDSAPRAVFGPDGRVLLAWSVQDGGVRAATLTPAGVVERHALGTPVRDVAAVTPLVLLGGARVLAWADNTPYFSPAPFAGRLHLALEGHAAAAVPAPAIEVGAPRDRSLRPAQPLELPVRCAAACDVRGALDDDPSGDPGFSLSRAGRGLLRFRFDSTGVARRRGGAVGVRLRWSAPGSGAVSTRTVRVRLRRLPAPRLPRILDLRARRLPGGKVEVRWRTDGPALDALWFVVGSRVRTPERQGDIVAVGSVPRGDRRRYRVVLDDARAARHVQVTLSPLVGEGRRAATTPVP